MILELEGETGVGKTTLAYTAPLPIVSAAFDAGIDRALYGSRWRSFDGIDIEIVKYPPVVLEDASQQEKFWTRNNGRAITIYLLPQGLQTSNQLQGNRVLWSTFTRLSTMAIQSPKIATVVCDTMTIARRVAADSYLETLQNQTLKLGERHRVQLLQIEYSKPNDYVRTVYSTAQNQVEAFASAGIQKHFIATHHLVEQRREFMDAKGEMQSVIVTGSDGQPKLRMEGLVNTYRFVDVAIRMEKSQVDNVMVPGQKLTVIQGLFQKCGYDLSLEGTKITSPTWDSLATLLNRNLHERARIQLRDK